jgi:zinc protease
LRITRSIAVLAAAVVLTSAPSLAQTKLKPKWQPETFMLDNGMEVVVLPDHRAPVVTHVLWYRVGSADEVKGKSGLAHFLEHLMFKGTPSIPAGEYSKVVARNGGQDNASTSFDYTNYYFRVAKDRLPLMMRMEADRMLNLELTDEEVLPERKVVQEERRQNTDSSPGAILDEMVYAEMYENHPYAIPPVGKMAEVAKLTRDDAADWYHTWYGPENAVLVVAGDITVKELKPLAESIYGRIPRRGDLKQRDWPKVKPLSAPTEVSYSDPKVRQPEWTRYWLGVPYGDPDAEALEVGIAILAGGRTSRLYRELVEKGDAVMVYGYSMEMEAPGVIMINASPSEGVSMEEMQLAALTATDEFLRDGPTDAELARAKKMIAAEAIFSRDNQMSMADWYGSLLIAGQKLDYIEGWEDRVRAVTAEDVKRAMNAYVTDKPYVDALLLPEGK